MFGKSTALVTGIALLALVFAAATPAGKKPPPEQSDKQAPTTPTNLRITSSTDTSISLAWDASTDYSTNWWYCVQRDGAGCLRVSSPQTSINVSWLTRDRTTTWNVYAIDAAGNRSASSNGVTFTTPPDTTAPSPAPTVTASIVVPTWVHINWTESFDNLTQVSYEVLLDGRPVWDSVGYTFLTAFDLLPSSTAHALKGAEERTVDRRGGQDVNFALGYGGRRVNLLRRV